MKKLTFIIILLSFSILAFSQKVEDFISHFANQECCQIDYVNEDEWRYAKYVFSNIDPPYYDLDRDQQIRDTVNSFWFDQVFLRREGDSNNYSLNFRKVKESAARADVANVPEIKEFVFIGMKIPLLEKAKTIQQMDLEDCWSEVKESFRNEARKLADHYTVITSVKDDESDILLLKNKEEDSFYELIMIELGQEPHLLRMEGIFEMSDISAPKDYNE